MMFTYSSSLRSAVIYEVNIRQITPEGTFRAFKQYLPQLKKMGIDVLWLMPIHPIGRVNRKGTLGSYYAISNHRAINPEFGSEADFVELVTAIHKLDMKLIIDWVANHAAWDHVWTKTHPDFFCRTDENLFISPYDWSDVIQINHNNKLQRQSMIEAMQYWVKYFDVDGFRADLAHLTPLDFWLTARSYLQSVKENLIWLAESEEVTYHEAFDITFTWRWMHITEKVIKEKAGVHQLKNCVMEQLNEFPPHALRLYFTSNHDENSWNGTEFEKYGDCSFCMFIAAATLPNAIPLIYSGQEWGNTKRLAFFEKDCIDYSATHPLHTFYASVVACRKQLYKILEGNAHFSFLSLSDEILAYEWTNENQKVVVLLNLGEHFFQISLSSLGVSGSANEWFTNTIYKNGELFQLQGYGYAIFMQTKPPSDKMAVTKSE